MDGLQAPLLLTPVPGPRSRALIDRLALRECPAITARRARRASALGKADDDPFVWSQARGANVWDADGNRFVDLSSGFGVATIGHRNPAVVAALQAQSQTLLHAMGDAYPDPGRIALMELLCARTGLDRVILGSSGSDAVEAALKTARMATGRDGVLAFEGSYHGLSYGALAASAYRSDAFRGPFVGQLGDHVRHAQFGGVLPSVDQLQQVGAVLVEPIQGRGGIRVPPAGWLAELGHRARRAGALLVLDEIYTGFGRTGTLFRYQAEDVLPDLLCVGKGMAGGFPISACVGTAAVMDAWGASGGEALHTQTFLGNPLGCAMALAGIEEAQRLLPAANALGQAMADALRGAGRPVQGAGLLLGVQLPDPLAASRALLGQGYIALPAGEGAEMVLVLAPPMVATLPQVQGALDSVGSGPDPGG